MKRKLTEYGDQVAGVRSWCWMTVVALVAFPLLLQAQDSTDQESLEAVWQPKAYKFSRYQKMITKAPFGKVPLNAPPPAVVEQAPPPEEKQLAIAAVSVVEGKPVVYLIDLRTRAYQQINTEEENESKIRLIEISDESNPRDVVAQVMINGRLTTVKYDTGLLDGKPKLAGKKGRNMRNVAGSRSVQATRPPTVNAASSSALVQNAMGASSNIGTVKNGSGTLPQHTNRVSPAAGKQIPVTRSIQDQRRLSTVPRRRVIVPGQSTSRQVTPSLPVPPEA